MFTVIDLGSARPEARLLLLLFSVPLVATTAATAAVLSAVSWSPQLVEAWVATRLSDEQFTRHGALMSRALRLLVVLPPLLLIGLGGGLLATAQLSPLPYEAGVATLLLGPALYLATWGALRARALRWHFPPPARRALLSAAGLLTLPSCCSRFRPPLPSSRRRC